MLEDVSSGFWSHVWEFLLLYCFFFVLRLIAILCACDRFILAAKIVPIGAYAPVSVEACVWGYACVFLCLCGGFLLACVCPFWRV